jgi:hypothetical protein
MGGGDYKTLVPEGNINCKFSKFLGKPKAHYCVDINEKYSPYFQSVWDCWLMT